jgi:hypothetical protein
MSYGITPAAGLNWDTKINGETGGRGMNLLTMALQRGVKIERT